MCFGGGIEEKPVVGKTHGKGEFFIGRIGQLTKEIAGIRRIWEGFRGSWKDLGCSWKVLGEGTEITKIYKVKKISKIKMIS